jgi:hypothetical protein
MSIDIISKIIENINVEQENSPFLFVWENLELTNEKVKTYALEILKRLSIPQVYLYKLEDNWESIKIWELKSFLSKSNSKPAYKIQIFLIENFSRISITAANSCLKIFEEPTVHNIFFITNASEAWILDTILSRVQVINLNIKKIENKNSFFYELIWAAIKDNNTKNLVSYFFKSKLEKEEYISFLKTFIYYIKKELILIKFLDEVLEDINMIERNNVLARNTIDKWIIKIINYEK